jgi:hypothetical protein
MLNLDAIQPNPLGKYSPLLYKWLTHKRQKIWNPPVPTVLQTQIETVSGRKGWRDHFRPRDLILGRGEFDQNGLPIGIGGRRLSDIICGARGVLSHGFYYSAGFGLRDVTEAFWSEYERIGRCAWDRDHTLHMIGDEKRWHYIAGGRQRECQWCGRVFEVERTTVVYVREREVWTEYRPTVPATVLHPMGSMGEEA